MADFDLTTIVETAAQRLDAVAADCLQRGQSMFEQALADQRALLASLASPADPLMASTSSRAASLAATPPPKPASSTEAPGDSGSTSEAEGT